MWHGSYIIDKNHTIFVDVVTLTIWLIIIYMPTFYTYANIYCQPLSLQNDAHLFIVGEEISACDPRSEFLEFLLS